MTAPENLAPLPQAFYTQHATIVARALLGALLVRRLEDQLIVSRIVETEAYSGLDDLASHGRVGRTPRNLPMWEAPGHAYVYLIYGRYWLLNIVVEPAEQPAAVLLRAVEPLSGEGLIAARRPLLPPRQWTKGPGRLTLALDIDSTLNRADMTSTADGLWISEGEPVEESAVSRGPRIGLGKHVYEPWLNIPWRYWVTDNPHVSR